MSKCCKYYANPWITLKPQFKPEEEQEMDMGYYWKVIPYYARIYCIQIIWEKDLTNSLILVFNIYVSAPVIHIPPVHLNSVLL